MVVAGGGPIVCVGSERLEVAVDIGGVVVVLLGKGVVGGSG
jgi:hypothetical protein